METAVKERLMGAVVLVGLIVALVPEMLSGPRREGTGHSASTDGAVRTFTIDLAPPTAPDAETQESVDAAAGDAPAVTADRATEPSESASRAAERVDSSPPTEVTARPDTPPANADTAWAVQLGSFASRENAERLAAEIKQGGYRAFVSRFEAGRSVRYRVRVGPEQDRAQAEALARRLQRDGRQVSIVSHP